MKKQSRKVLLGAATLAAVMAVGQKDVNAATTNIDMTAKIIKAVEITKTASLKFGSLTQTGTAASGTVTVTNADVRTAGGGGALSLVGGAGAGQPGGFQLKAATGVAINVNGPTTATVKNGTKTMTVSQFTINAAAGTIKATPFVTTLAAATKTGFKLGGTLKVKAGVALNTGTYTGTVTLTAAYQ